MSGSHNLCLRTVNVPVDVFYILTCICFFSFVFFICFFPPHGKLKPIINSCHSYYYFPVASLSFLLVLSVFYQRVVYHMLENILIHCNRGAYLRAQQTLPALLPLPSVKPQPLPSQCFIRVDCPESTDTALKSLTS